ncbi:PIN domain-containing protein [Synechococcus sp. CS-1333]|uniref:PIN domain-containing protein n=1 Tax=Synechococcus sp. CS-1333 TaxID=2848638 RepID=UPI0037DA073F
MLDTCALFGPVLRDVLLEAAWDGMYRPHWSNEILAELGRNLRKLGKDDAYINHLGAELRKAFPEAIISLPSGLELGLTCDYKDRHVLAAAIAGQCSLIVTQNTRDFPGASTEPFGITVVSPSRFLCELFDLDRGQMVECLNRIAVRRTSTVEQLLNSRGLTSQAPTFTQECRTFLGLPNPTAP